MQYNNYRLFNGKRSIDPKRIIQWTFESFGASFATISLIWTDRSFCKTIKRTSIIGLPSILSKTKQNKKKNQNKTVWTCHFTYLKYYKQLNFTSMEVVYKTICIALVDHTYLSIIVCITNAGSIVITILISN